MDKNKFGLGDLVRVVNYGSTRWESDGKGGVRAFESAPERIGREGMISEVNNCQDWKWQYALETYEGSCAWFFEDQLEMISRNPNNDIPLKPNITSTYKTFKPDGVIQEITSEEKKWFDLLLHSNKNQ